MQILENRTSSNIIVAQIRDTLKNINYLVAGAHLRPQEAKKTWKTLNIIFDNIHNNYNDSPFFIFVDANIDLSDKNNECYLSDIN